ncbi:MAG: hypothetical protein KC505_08295, partial [Myxococcales bacterium]|nr:hypothetical protein [Myxococcales bacterium]
MTTKEKFLDVGSPLKKQNKFDLIFSKRSLTAQKKLLSHQDKKNLLQGMLVTRATDNALKHIFLSGEIKYLDKSFQGKGFRSLGQEAIYGAAYWLKRTKISGQYQGDIVAPLIRDLGVFLCCSDLDIEAALNAQAGKIGLPCQGRDLHLGDYTKGILTPAAPLAIATSTLIGLALSFKIKNLPRIALSFIGEGGSSLGEWHEAINFAAVKKLPMIFCIENNQTALSTPLKEQSRVNSFADKAAGYGIPSIVLDGNDVCELAAGFKLVCDFVRTGNGPVLVEVITMRMCGHAHHDDMLYLGSEPKLSFEIPALNNRTKDQGYVDSSLYEAWRKKDPITNFKNTLLTEKIITENSYENMKNKALEKVQTALESIKTRAWPQLENEDDESLVYKRPYHFNAPQNKKSEHYFFDKQGSTYLQAISQAVNSAFTQWPECFLIGEDVALPYGNAFMMFKSTPQKFADRFINTPISESAIVGACAGMSLAGIKAIGEIQFNDFIACAMNQVANNVAKHYFRTGLNLPLVLRMPYGGLRRAGPFHSQDSSAWFYRCHGLKIMAPSTPIDAYFMLLKAIEDPDPVLFYEHINLYRDPNIKQIIPKQSNNTAGAMIIKPGSDITIISYGAYVHKAFNAAQILFNKDKINAEIIDLRYLKPIDFATCYASIKKTSKVLLLTEDSQQGSLMENIAGRLGQDMFHHLDAPVTVL